ncbi:MAG: cytochrome c [Vicinamibacterales bacterium]
MPRRIGTHWYSTTFVCGLVLVWWSLLIASVGAQNLGGSPEAKRVKSPVPSTPASIAAGAAAFKKYCSFCHGEGGKGDGRFAPKGSMPADLTDAKWDRGSTDGEIHAVIVNGAGPKFEMKGLKMPDQDMWNVINYLRSIGPAAAKR